MDIKKIKISDLKGAEYNPRKISKEERKEIRNIGEKIYTGIWKRMLKYYNGNIKDTLNYLVKEEKRMLKNSEKATKTKIKFFNKLAKIESKGV